VEQRLHISSLAPDAKRISRAIPAHWFVENRLHWCMDVAFNDAHNLAALKHIALNLIRLGPHGTKGRH